MLQECGIMRSECYTTNVLKVRPPNNQIGAFVAMTKKEIGKEHSLLRDKYVTREVHEGYAELLAEIEMVQPNIIVAFGNLAMWALTGQWGILKWRGSQLSSDQKIKVVPTIHPASILREWSNRAIALSDLRRVKKHMTTREWERKPEWLFTLCPSLTAAVETLSKLLTRAEQETFWVEFDLETSIATKHIKCAGISWSRVDAICIPFTDAGKDYWNADEEALLIYLLYKLLTHKNVFVRGQNLLFDCQYTHRYWHFIPNVKQDTMISQHSVFCALPKGLDFLASMYCDWYTNWKMEEHS